MTKFIAVDTANIRSSESRPDQDSVISGDPRFTLWEVDDAGSGLTSGIWEATPGKWHFENAHWEYCRILAGASVITEANGETHSVQKGDSFILKPGFKGTWEVIETTRKDYIAR